MDRMLFTAMSGANQALEQQAVVANNLANIVTPGFRAQLVQMQSSPVAGEGLPTRVSVSATGVGVDWSEGPITHTDRNLDVALGENTLLAVQTADGQEAYTRRGDLQVDGSGAMTVAGLPVMGDGGPISVPLGSEVSLGSDGTISVREQGMEPRGLSPVGKLKLVSALPGTLEAGNDGLLRQPADANGIHQQLAADESLRVTPGALEGSNVSPTGAMVAMIDNARRYEMQMKAISAADDNAKSANQLLALQG
ncbi:flagellar basal body rod protein FlgF [Pseudomonas putida]|jgi:flagellar basal-body rod protein FlgF|uniref:Flagellar basal-body rod protein FlgF n=3 Tax=Pseudomonas TaxID=286 RepID=A0A7Y7Z5P2_PSEPU|nr:MULTISPECIES: flagellar basal body rod protein FlgF [Pseudomonas]QPN45702.1 flagellar basal body rod protein FlgF [Priestia aryabhattai]MBG6125264.1 flagellar basal-body rod protein FlgF [Pseudomonas sp. M2]NSX18643.1 flagellar basal body rod protein FlgF [Pseudomonas putida]NWC78731.1 flagellar basal body rod protein FlgF [Pseudomonas putida]RRV47097.1 flagellar basal body rod protein FlgF [Pseudomonas sp. p106]